MSGTQKLSMMGLSYTETQPIIIYYRWFIWYNSFNCGFGLPNRDPLNDNAVRGKVKSLIRHIFIYSKGFPTKKIPIFVLFKHPFLLVSHKKKIPFSYSLSIHFYWQQIWFLLCRYFMLIVLLIFPTLIILSFLFSFFLSLIRITYFPFVSQSFNIYIY